MATRDDPPAAPPAPGGAVYPVGLRLLDRRVVVVGGGQVAHRRVAGLVEARARVTVVSRWAMTTQAFPSIKRASALKTSSSEAASSPSRKNA